MDSHDLIEPGPDGYGWWPDRFGVDGDWADDRGTAWRAVTNHPTLQARRDGGRLDLRQTDDLITHTYRLESIELPAYLAIKEN